MGVTLVGMTSNREATKTEFDFDAPKFNLCIFFHVCEYCMCHLVFNDAAVFVVSK